MRIEEAFRNVQMQRTLITSPEVFDGIVTCCAWESGLARPRADLVFRRSQCLVANYPLNATHMYGAAVDISVIGQNMGKKISRGEPCLHMGEATPMNSLFVSIWQTKSPGHHRDDGATRLCALP